MPVFMDGSGCSDPISCSWCFQYFPIHYCIGSCRKLLDLRVQAALTGRAIPMPQELPEISKQCLVLEPVNIMKHAASGWRRFLLGFTLAESQKLFWCKNAGAFGRFLCMNNLQNVDLHLSDLSAGLKVPRECGVRQNAPNWVQSRGKVVAIFWFCFHTVGICWAKLFKGS